MGELDAFIGADYPKRHQVGIVHDGLSGMDDGMDGLLNPCVIYFFLDFVANKINERERPQNRHSTISDSCTGL